tara:strand:- start:2738 stop:3673 length:936 start_codon:yes stop_codon:yes gene_type:complete
MVELSEEFYSFNQYLRKQFGERVQRISLDAGFNCPNLDGSLSEDGCSYCNNKGFSHYAGSLKSLEDQIRESIEFYSKSAKANKFIAYFQAFSNTNADIEVLKERYEVIRKFPQIVGLFISTRCDCIDENKLKLISEYKKDYLVWLEYGLQTTHDKILAAINRNHTCKDFLKTLEQTRKFDINVGVHMILGLPDTTTDDILLDARRLSSLDIQGIKLHSFHILKDTPFHKLYESNKIKLLSRQEYVDILFQFLQLIPKDMVVFRLSSSANPDYLVAPEWINQKGKVIGELRIKFKEKGICQGFLHENSSFKN